MTQSLHPAAKRGFSRSAELYQQVRPDYPAEISQWLNEMLGLAADAHLLDLGSGTGKFIPYLRPLSRHIIAVDPVPEMLAQLKMAHPDIDAIEGVSHQLPLPDHSLNAVFCAQSFHWFANAASLKELDRVLKPHGFLVLIWNQRDTRVDWVQALADCIAPLEGDAPRFHSGAWREVFAQQTLFQPYAETTMTQQQHGPVEQVVSKRLLSTSFIAAMPTAQQVQLKLQFEQIIQQYTAKHSEEMIDFPYITHIYVFKKST
ncbi:MULTISPECIES: class I SAM-dependent methyltransferase [unclassified Acinetobacter]|uniref:class I SAM-dependent methyltransferase n=1 Tax=unclassified Acinetobacter TaxID=196816 RepID=UPI001C237647|nr:MULTISPECIES: class I SAM-dependent methyltransferase [unclassified Acinetobacter]